MSIPILPIMLISNTSIACFPHPEILLYNSPSLFAGKMHAVLCRSWKHGVKGRDLYDYIFLLSRNIPVNFNHLMARLIQSGYLQSEETFELEDLKQCLMDHFDTIDYKQAKEDVTSFIRTQALLQVWKSSFSNRLHIIQQLQKKYL